MFSEPVEHAKKRPLAGRLRQQLRVRTRCRRLVARLALPGALPAAWRRLRSLPQTYWASLYRLCCVYVILTGKLPRVYWWKVYRLCFTLVLLRAMGRARLRRVWQYYKLKA